MTDGRFAKVRDADTPDLWPEIQRRIETGGPSDHGLDTRPRRGSRLAGAALATLVIVVAGLGLVWAATRGSTPPSPSGLASSWPPGALIVKVSAPPGSATEGPPSAAVTFAGSSGRMGIHSASGAWNTPEPVLFPRILLAFRTDVPIGSPIAVTGDAVSATVRLRLPTGPSTGASLTLQSGVGRLPNRPGGYVLEVSASWPDRTATFAIAVHLVSDKAQLSARVVLPSTTMGAGSSMSGQVVVDNNTGHAVRASGCISPFQVALGNDRITPSILWPLCMQPFTFPVGESSWPVTVSASYLECGSGKDSVHCKDGRPQPLPPGDYRAMLFQEGHIVRTPPPIGVHVTP